MRVWTNAFPELADTGAPSQSVIGSQTSMNGRCPARPAEAIHRKGRLDGIEKGSEQRQDMIRRRDAQLEMCVK
jgi:hypothetical protein